MNNYNIEPRIRKRNLLVVEGNHERNELFSILLKCFDTIDISLEDIWIYGTNIYILYEDIKNEYGEDWDNEEVDLPFIISKKRGHDSISNKRDYNNIILIFDYERHDPNFSCDKIERMQQYFSDAADIGQLYINYPMIESYQHMDAIPDINYLNKTISVTVQPGIQYKNMVKNTLIRKYIEFPNKLEKELLETFNIGNDEIRSSCINKILNISKEDNLFVDLGIIFSSAMVNSSNSITAKYYFKRLIMDIGYAAGQRTYWGYMKGIFQNIIFQNIQKAYYIQTGIVLSNLSDYRVAYENLDLMQVLQKQNRVSTPINGLIWVLNTCIFVIADYNFSLLLTD